MYINSHKLLYKDKILGKHNELFQKDCLLLESSKNEITERQKMYHEW